MGYSFSGHETFTCRNYWLKKGLDHVWSGGVFGDTAIRELGVGKNMVGAIRFWTRAFGLIEFDTKYSELAAYIFNTRKGKDPYLEDIGTIWLLHYLLVTTETASIYSLVFNYFRKIRIEFNREQLLSFIKNDCQSKQIKYNLNSVKKDISVFLNNYLIPESSKSVEADFMGLLYELNLIDRVRKEGHIQTYKIENQIRSNIPSEIILTCILLKVGNSSVTFNELLNGINSVGSVFAINAQCLMNCIDDLSNKYPDNISYKDDGGVQVFQIKEGLELFNVLNGYYGN